MKKLLLFLLTAAGLEARDVTVSWDANPTGDYVTAYAVQYKIGPDGEWSAPILVTSADAHAPYDVPTSVKLSQFPEALCYMRAFAQNEAGDGPYSVELAVPVLPGGMKGFKFKIDRKVAQLSFEGEGQGIIAIQQSVDLEYWWDIATGQGKEVIGTAVDTTLWDRAFFRGVTTST